MSDEIAERVETLEVVMWGPKGHPEKSLVVQVENITRSIGTLVKFLWAMSLTCGSLFVKEILTLMTNAG